MIKADLVDMVAKETKITKTQAERAVNAAIESLRDALTDGRRIELRGFGVFQVKPQKEASVVIRGQKRKWKFHLGKRFGSNREKICKTFLEMDLLVPLHPLSKILGEFELKCLN